MDSLNQEKQLYLRAEKKENDQNEERGPSQSLFHSRISVLWFLQEGEKGMEGWRLITAETIPDQTSVSNCPANRKEPDKQRNLWPNLKVVQHSNLIKLQQLI